MTPDRDAVLNLSSPPTLITDPDLGFENDLQSRLLAMWRDRCTGHRLPARRDFDVLELKEYMGWLCVVEVLPGGEDLIYRLVGTGVVDRMGRDITGKRVSEVLPPAALRIHQHLMRHPQPLRTYGEIGWVGREFILHETLLLPLADDGKTVDRFFLLITYGTKDHSAETGR